MSAKIFGKLSKDCSVKIKRSNGKVHDANVQSFNEENKTVHVEWFENEDIKGKELPVSTVLSLNPEYKTQEMKEVKESSTSNVTTNNGAAANIGRKSIFIAKSQSRLKENKIPVRSKAPSAAPQQQPTASSSSMEPPTTSSQPKGRKSEVVRNMEKIESDRVARRNEQKQARYQRDQQRAKHDVNDKQWEFAQM
jgi:kinesin family protein 2/24